jgi:predicted esterase
VQYLTVHRPTLSRHSTTEPGEEKVGRNWTAFYKDPATPTDNLKRRLSNFYRFHATAIAVGYSNGANIAASMLLLRPQVLSAAVLFRPMAALAPQNSPNLSGIPIFIAAGRTDSLISPDDTQRLVKLLEGAGAEVTIYWNPGGHTLSSTDVQAAREWLLSQGLGTRIIHNS